LILDINQKLDFIRYNYEKFRDGKPHQLHIERGETTEATELYQILEQNRALLGEKIYVPLRHKYDQAILLYKTDLDWQQEIKTWSELSERVQRLMEEEFRFSEARLHGPG